MASKRIIWAGRFVHAKGRLGMKLGTEIFPMFKRAAFELYAGPLPGPGIIEANDNVRFMGVVNDLQNRMQGADLVLGGGRVALEAMQQGTPVMAVGQKCYVGVLSRDNMEFAMHTNFGDMYKKDVIDYDQLVRDLGRFLDGGLAVDTSFYPDYLAEYQLQQVSDRIKHVYKSAIAKSGQ